MWVGASAVVWRGFVVVCCGSEAGRHGDAPIYGGVCWFLGRFARFWAYILALIVIRLSMALMLSILGGIGPAAAEMDDLLAKLATAGGGWARWPAPPYVGGTPLPPFARGWPWGCPD